MSALASAAVAAGLVLTAAGVAPAAPSDGVECGWRHTAVHVLAELDAADLDTESGGLSPGAARLRSSLRGIGADEPGFVPRACHTTNTRAGQGTPVNRADDHESGSIGRKSRTGQDARPGTASAVAGASSGQDSAGERFGWGVPDKVDDFTRPGLDGWNLYDGPGHAGNGIRSPEAATVSDGVLTINGTRDGTTGGMAWGDPQKYGRWEVRMRAPQGSPAYNALALLWPSAENFPVGGEIDFAEIMDPARDTVELFLHYGADNSQVHGEVRVDATQWHNYAVEWTPEGVTAFLDGEQWWKTTDTSILPPGPMHLTLQLDWFPDGKADGGTGQVQYDWVKQWGLARGEGSSTDTAGSDGSTAADASTTITDEINNGGRASGAGDGRDIDRSPGRDVGRNGDGAGNDSSNEAAGSGGGAR